MCPPSLPLCSHRLSSPPRDHGADRFSGYAPVDSTPRLYDDSWNFLGNWNDELKMTEPMTPEYEFRLCLTFAGTAFVHCLFLFSSLLHSFIPLLLPFFFQVPREQRLPIRAGPRKGAAKHGRRERRGAEAHQGMRNARTLTVLSIIRSYCISALSCP